MATLESIEARIAKLQAQAQAITKKQSAGVIAQIHSLMAKHGITMEDLGSASAGKQRGTKMASKSASATGASNAKFRDPKSGATWSGHGRAPGWIASAKNRDKFLIEGSSPPEAVGGKKTAKLGNYIRGKQPAMYRDPKTGKEWSGRGMAPGWLASAKDRTKFLIDGNATTAPTADKTSAKPVGNYVRGPQPAKYRDPKSGAEWSGRGKAPAWLAGAKDRTKFLIEGAATATATATAADAKSSAPKAVAAKKAEAKKATSTASAKKSAAKKASTTMSAKKGAAKKSSATSAKTSGGKGAASKKSTPATKKGPQVGSKKAAGKKVAVKRYDGKVAAEIAPDAATSQPASSSDANAATSAS